MALDLDLEWKNSSEVELTRNPVPVDGSWPGPGVEEQFCRRTYQEIPAPVSLMR